LILSIDIDSFSNLTRHFFLWNTFNSFVTRRLIFLCTLFQLMNTNAWGDTIIASCVYSLSKETPQAMLASLQHAILVWAVSYTGCRVFYLLDVPQTQATHGKGRQACGKGDVALGLTNDLDTWVWISFTSITASKCTSLSLRIHMAFMGLQRIQKQPTGRLFFISIYCSLLHLLTSSLT